MILEFKKGDKSILGEYFEAREFDCKCAHVGCDYTLIDSDLTDSLWLLREKVGPLKITSGFRCSRHNRDVGGKPGSYHLLGKAADVKPIRASIITVKFAAESIPMFACGGIGKASTFLHLDTRGYSARWHY